MDGNSSLDKTKDSRCKLKVPAEKASKGTETKLSASLEDRGVSVSGQVYASCYQLMNNY